MAERKFRRQYRRGRLIYMVGSVVRDGQQWLSVLPPAQVLGFSRDRRGLVVRCAFERPDGHIFRNDIHVESLLKQPGLVYPSWRQACQGIMRRRLQYPSEQWWDDSEWPARPSLLGKSWRQALRDKVKSLLDTPLACELPLP